VKGRSGAHCDSVTKAFTIFTTTKLDCGRPSFVYFTRNGRIPDFRRAAHLVASGGVLVAVRLVLIRLSDLFLSAQTLSSIQPPVPPSAPASTPPTGSKALPTRSFAFPECNVPHEMSGTNTMHFISHKALAVVLGSCPAVAKDNVFQLGEDRFDRELGRPGQLHGDDVGFYLHLAPSVGHRTSWAKETQKDCV
jgi:hypothetical protein